MRMANSYTPPEIRFRRRFLISTLAIGALLAAVFAADPDLDLEFSRKMQLCPGAAVFAPWCAVNPFAETLRNLFIAASVLITVAVLIGLLHCVRERKHMVGLAQARWWFLLAALTVSPGLVANLVLKDHWGRARPRTIVEFGGSKQFTPPLLIAHECRRNCSFVSGEASSAYVPFFAAAMVFPQSRAALLLGGIASGLAAGLVRVSQGGHFLSDILFAGVFMALTVSVLHLLIIGLWRTRGPEFYLAPPVRRLADRFTEFVSAHLTRRR